MPSLLAKWVAMCTKRPHGGWDAPAFCENLCNAVRGDLPGCPNGACHSYSDFTGRMRRQVRAESHMREGASTTLQKQIYLHIAESEPDPWVELLSKRLPAICPLLTPIDLDSTVLMLATHLKELGPHCASCVIKTLTNSWCTSSRFHEDNLLPCIFGRFNASDTVEHYLSCDCLWTTIASCANLSAAWFCNDIGTQLELQNANHHSLKILCVSFRLYHAIKMGYYDLVLEAQASGIFDKIQLLAFELGNLLCCEFDLR